MNMSSSELTPITDLERDALGELANLAMGRAATSLRQMLGAEVRLSVPEVEILLPGQAIDKATKPGDPNLVAIRQDFSGAFSGRALLIFPEANSLELVRGVVAGHLSREDVVELEDEALAETGNVILTSWISTIANVLTQRLKISLPVVIRRSQQNILEGLDSSHDHVLFLHIKFEVSRREIHGYVALLMDIRSIAQLRSLIAEFVMKLSRPDA
jgi:chemotaxis protein CheC